MKHFFLRTYYFWVFTRIIFIAFGIIDLFVVIPKGLSGVNALIDIFTICYLTLMVYNTVVEIGNKTWQPVTKYIVGVISILIGTLIFFLVIAYNSNNIFVAFLFVAWVVLLGIFDLLIMNRQEDEIDIQG